MRTIKVTILSVVLATLTACGGQSQNSNKLPINSNEGVGIMGGDLKTDFKTSTNFVNIVSVNTAGTSAIVCSGVVLSKRAILTAAYCVADVSKISVSKDDKFKFSDRTSLLQQMNAGLAPNRVALNPKFLQRTQNDEAYTKGDALAVLHFAADLPGNFTPVTLPSSSVSLSVGDELTIAGFGLDQNKAATAIVQVLNPYFVHADNLMLLSQSRLNGACFGDGGGPAFANDANGKSVLVGIAGFQNSTVDSEDIKNCKNGAVYYRIDAPTNLSWLKAQALK